MGHSFGATVLYSLASHKDFDPNISDLLIGIAGPLQDPRKLQINNERGHFAIQPHTPTSG